MLAHTKTHLTEKNILKNKIKNDIFAFKKHLVKKVHADDLTFIKELKDELEMFLGFGAMEIIPADNIFQSLTEKYGKAGMLLRGLRVREGLNQTEFAKIIDTTQANVSSMENGSRPIGKNKAKLIAKMFGVDYRYFL
jgi:DNA-binding XRE family transcriptional regulator